MELRDSSYADATWTSVEENGTTYLKLLSDASPYTEKIGRVQSFVMDRAIAKELKAAIEKTFPGL